MHIIDLRSDTVTLPTEEMREAMARAPVGDDVYGDDPAVNELEARSAALLGKQAAMFVPSGTFGNQVCVMAHTRRGDEILLGEDAHILWHEGGAAAVLSAVQTRTFPVDGRRIDVARLEAMIRPDDIHEPPTGLICLENARGNGMALGMETMRAVRALADRHGIPVHLDGARLFNAANALGLSARELADCTDSLSFCLSKGLAAPVGSVVVGSADFIRRARRCRKLMGGGLRQAGILAAAGIWALDHMVERLAQDHENARLLAAALSAIPGVTVDTDALDINMVFFTLPETILPSAKLCERLLERGIKAQGWDGSYRFVTHHGVGREDIDTITQAMRACVAEAQGG